MKVTVKITRDLEEPELLVEAVQLSTGKAFQLAGQPFKDYLGSDQIVGNVFSVDIKSTNFSVYKHLANLYEQMLVDVHQPHSHTKKLNGVLHSLYSADYAWYTRHGLSVGIEAKLSGADLFSSAWTQHGDKQARLANQIPKLVQSYDIPILLYNVGDLDCTPDGYLRIPSMGEDLEVTKRFWSSLWDTLLGYQIHYPSLCLWPSKRAWRVPQDILAIRSYLNKEKHTSQVSNPKAAINNLFKVEAVDSSTAWLASLVGVEAAKKALSVYPSIRQLLEAPAKEVIKNVKGWGPKTQTKLEDAVGIKT